VLVFVGSKETQRRDEKRGKGGARWGGRGGGWLWNQAERRGGKDGMMEGRNEGGTSSTESESGGPSGKQCTIHNTALDTGHEWRRAIRSAFRAGIEEKTAKCVLRMEQECDRCEGCVKGDEGRRPDGWGGNGPLSADEIWN